MTRTRAIALMVVALAFDAAVVTTTATIALVDDSPNYAVLSMMLTIANVLLVASLLLAITSSKK